MLLASDALEQMEINYGALMKDFRWMGGLCQLRDIDESKEC